MDVSCTKFHCMNINDQGGYLVFVRAYSLAVRKILTATWKPAWHWLKFHTTVVTDLK